MKNLEKTKKNLGWFPVFLSLSYHFLSFFLWLSLFFGLETTGKAKKNQQKNTPKLTKPEKNQQKHCKKPGENQRNHNKKIKTNRKIRKQR